MQQLQIYNDPQKCEQIWEDIWPKRCLFDLWPVRACFATSYKRLPHFLVVEKNGRAEGGMALSRVEEHDCYMHFPGEIWKGKTWIEQNKIPAPTTTMFTELCDSVPGMTHLRYLTRDAVPMDSGPIAVDEVGYLFFPARYAFSFQNYLQEFSGKSRKKLSRELEALERHGVVYRHDNVADVQWLFRMNLEAFGEDSYFYDPRFLDAIDKLVMWLHGQDMLRVTTILLGGTVAAVDIGAVWNKTYTVLAGATNPNFPGIAKMINFHHLEWACRQQMEVVDFLCGDFGWKQRFRLTGRPLYEMRIQPGIQSMPCEPMIQVGGCEQ